MTCFTTLFLLSVALAHGGPVLYNSPQHSFLKWQDVRTLQWDLEEHNHVLPQVVDPHAIHDSMVFNHTFMVFDNTMESFLSGHDQTPGKAYVSAEVWSNMQAFQAYASGIVEADLDSEFPVHAMAAFDVSIDQPSATMQPIMDWEFFLRVEAVVT